ncbi:uncharacterized protein [Halyomorpha halys]|uniref:uncharacterized protein n=1 Tax=Halyomorpha halys TaxID=286706 RepID=UPI0006D4EF41|nr:uncharacterized protein LOC106682223 [Halyomorpha halys]
MAVVEGKLCGEGSELLPCLELGLVRRAKELLDKDTIQLGGGLELKRREGASSEGDVPPLNGSEERQVEDYAVQEVGHFLEQRSVVWNLAEAVDSVAQFLPSDGTEEGRGKRKKLLRALLPILVAVKMKVAGFLILAYIVIALIAKKALLSSLISLAVSAFIGIKKLMSGGGGHHHVPSHHEVYEPVHGWSGWDDSQGAYSSNVIAYQGHKPIARYGDKNL